MPVQRCSLCAATAAAGMQVDADMYERAQRGAAAGQLETGYESDVDEEERALLERQQGTAEGRLQLQRHREQQRQQEAEAEQAGREVSSLDC